MKFLEEFQTEEAKMSSKSSKQLWILKHAPKKLGDCTGNDEPREELRKWALAWEGGNPEKPLMLAGPTGVGKTAAVRALAREMNWLLFETNASELRDKEFIQKTYGAASQSLGLFGQKRLLVVDEADAALDKGGASAIAAFLESARQPALVVANDAWEPKISAVRAACRILDFKPINARSVKKVLEKIVAEEKNETNGPAHEISPEFIEQVSAGCEGDLRSAITDLQAGFAGSREKKSNVFKVVGKIFKTIGYWDAVRAADEAEIDFDLLYRWIEENIANEYEKPAEIALAYQMLCRSNEFSSRVIKRQEWRLMKYARVLATAGVALSKKERYAKFTRYNFPSIIKKYSAAREARAALKSALKKAAAKTHSSLQEARETLEEIVGVTGAAEYFELEEGEAKLFSASELVKQKRGDKKQKRDRQ